jgi:hypothetical protein
MKKAITTTLISMLVLISSCAIFSIHPLYHSTDLLQKDTLLGLWLEEDNTKGSIQFTSQDDNDLYKTIMIDDSDTALFEAGLLELDGQLYLDFFPSEDCDFFGGGDCTMLVNLSNNYIPTHTFMKVDIVKNSLKITPFDGERLVQLFRQNRIRLAHEFFDPEEDQNDDFVVITASTDDLQKFVARYSNDEEAFDEPITYNRLP